MCHTTPIYFINLLWKLGTIFAFFAENNENEHPNDEKQQYRITAVND